MGCAARARRILVIAIAVYIVLGIVTTLAFAFFGGAKMGLQAFSQPRSYVICMFWPYSIVAYVLLMLGL